MSFSAEEIEEFRAEVLELIDATEKSLLALDQGAEFRACFNTIFRGFHNLKSASAMMEMHRLEEHSHELENILMGFKEATSLSKEYISFFLKGVDAARLMLNGETVKFDYNLTPKAPAEVVTLKDVAQPEIQAQPSPSSQLQPGFEEFLVEAEEILDRLSKSLQSIENEAFSKNTIDQIYRDVHSLKGSAYLFSFKNIGDLGHAMESSLEKVRNETHESSVELLDLLFESIKLQEGLLQTIKTGQGEEELKRPVSKLIQSLSVAEQTLAPRQKDTPQMSVKEIPKEAIKEKDQESASSIRVPVSVLDNLMTLMGEMVLVRNQILQYSNRTEDLEFLSMSKRINVVTSEIQAEMMKTRLQPIGNVLTKFHRVVRDLSQELDKSIQIEIHGAETELDKSLLEAIKDPLTHIIRNSCDHGIETMDVRRKNNKPAMGTIKLFAYHEGGQVIIEIKDDGKGLHKENLIKKSLEKGLISMAQAEKFSEKEAFHLIFTPGFSTAEKVTNVSGRGVGMDVVRTNIERIGGTIELTSQQGQGTTIKLKIPLTLAIVPALLIRCGQGTFAIPQVKLEELVRVDQSSENKIEILHGMPVFRLRGNILPLVDLNKILNIPSDTNYSERIINIAVLNADQSSFGVIFDEVQDTADIVVKPLNRLVKSLHVYSGATILGDGSVALILDVVGLSKVAQLGHSKTKAEDRKDDATTAKKKTSEEQDYLLVGLNSDSKHALVLGYVHRLEEFTKKQVEFFGDAPVIRYREHILPIVNSNFLLGYTEKIEIPELLHVVVILRGGSFYGLVVDEIIDTLSTDADLVPSPKKIPGLFGSLNLKNELIVVLDPFELIERAYPVAKAAPSAVVQTLQTQLEVGKTSPAHILFVEDTVFFRKTVKNLLEKEGYLVTTAGDGQDAIQILTQQPTDFDLIISDIEMPRMNGFDFATALKKNKQFSSIPLLALSSRADNDYKNRGLTNGFDIYLEKLKTDELLKSIVDLTKNKKQEAA